MHRRHLRTFVTVVVLVSLVFQTGAASSLSAGDDHFDFGAARVFVADDPDPKADALPPFVVQRLADVDQHSNLSFETVSRIRDFAFPTTHPQTGVGPHNQTLSEYRAAQLQRIPQSESTSRWIPQSNRSNGTVVKDAHITFLGVPNGTRTNVSRKNGTHFLPRNGRAMFMLDYATEPARTCRVSGQQKVCTNYSVVSQNVTRSLSIGNQSWADQNSSDRQIAYRKARARDPTTLTLRATIRTTVSKNVTRFTRGEANSSWEVVNTTASKQVLSHTVTDRANATVTTNQQLRVRQTVIENPDGTKQLIVRFRGPRQLSQRRLWSTATFGTTTLRNVWSTYSQRQYTTGYQSDPRGQTERQRAIALPHVLETQLIAQHARPQFVFESEAVALDRPELVDTESVVLAQQAAPLRQTVNLSSVPAQGDTQLVIGNARQPISSVRDIHGTKIPVETTQGTRGKAQIETKVVNDTHARVQVVDAKTGEPLRGQRLRLAGATQDVVSTDASGTAIVERANPYVSVQFTGTVITDGTDTYYPPVQARLEFPQEPFNIYQMVVSLAGALVSVVAFVVFYVPFWYLRS